METAKIKEIFASIQGEGPYVGVKQLFIRFSGCNLNCNFCDTDEEDCRGKFPDYTPEQLAKHIEQFDLKNIHTVSLTGGEPLLWADFLKEFLPLINNKIYLETNSTLNTQIPKIIDMVDIISADIKLPSASGVEKSFALHDEFFKVLQGYNKEVFAKIVFDENILDDEIAHCIKLAEKYKLPLILQPKTQDYELSVSGEKIIEVFDKFLTKYPNVRVIPQVHKYLQVL
ncbi:MAG TPA: 7-carboxy-7-deazaguanine synthase QueE [Candidatus Gastranaerophilaceae bacterium]|nr:7-carboxy-7-deazaguanine synthase QueE [Candidatus Gastranaerophilaceae bacterium]HPT41312.1 7-carboxy-7-deazaguanine synthase QueE [Candidatus Gastranaerophilaceae bacterium]